MKPGLLGLSSHHTLALLVVKHLLRHLLKTHQSLSVQKSTHYVVSAPSAGTYSVAGTASVKQLYIVLRLQLLSTNN